VTGGVGKNIGGGGGLANRAINLGFHKMQDTSL
jgi:hypothetical protein